MTEYLSFKCLFFKTEMQDTIKGLPQAVYAAFVRDKNHKERLLHTTDPFLLRKRLEVFFEEEKRAKMKELASSAFRRQVDGASPAIMAHFRPRTDVPDREYWGCDEHGYGWNLLGVAAGGGDHAETPQKVVFFLCPLLRRLVRLLEGGDPLTRFFHMSVAEIRESIGEMIDDDDHEDVTTEEETLMRDEVRYPGSLVHLVRRRYAPTVNAVLQDAIDRLLLEGACDLFGNDVELGEEPGQRLRENLRFLHEHKKLPLPLQILERVECLESRRWSEDEVWRAITFVPRSCHAAEMVFDETDDPVHSPLVPRTDLFVSGKPCRHVLEYVYFWLLREYVDEEDEAYRRVRSVETWSALEVGAMMAKAQREFMERLVEKWVECKYTNPRFQWDLLLVTEKIYVQIPHDPCLSDILSKTLTARRNRVKRETRRLCRWIAPRTSVTTRDFCAYYAIRVNLEMWDRLFEGVREEARPVVRKKFFRVFYSKKACDEEEAFRRSCVQPPETVLGRMQKELTTPLLTVLLKKKNEDGPRTVARILRNACFPQDLFHPRPRKILMSAPNEFLAAVLRHW